MPGQRRIPPSRAGAGASDATQACAVGRGLRCAVVRLCGNPAVAFHSAGAVVVPLRRARADLARNAFMDSTACDGHRRHGAMLLDRAHLPRACEALPPAVAGLSAHAWPRTTNPDC